MKHLPAVSIFLVGCLLSSVSLVLNTPNPGHPGGDEIARRSDQRFAALKAALPERGVVGYVGESGETSVPDYYLTQYALAPLVVDRSLSHPFVVGNFPASRPATIPENLRLVRDFGGGVLLLAKKDEK